jgi:hypothetical protein
MPGADASRGRLVYRFETVFGEAPPSNAATTRVRFTGESLHHRENKVLSEEIRPDRQRSDDVLAGFDTEGTVDAECTYGNFDSWFEAALGGTWTTNVLRNGTVNRSLNLEKGFTDIGKYIDYRGQVINTMDLNITARNIVKLSFGFMGSKGLAAATSIAGTTAPTEPNGNAPMSAGPDIFLLDSGGANIELGDVQTREVRLNVNNNTRLRDLATQYETDDVGRGVQEITGTLNAYFKDIVLYQGFLANSLFSLMFGFQDPDDATKSYRITLPRCRVTDAQPSLPGNDSDVMMPVTFRAFADAAVGYTINWERAVTLP